MTVTLSERCAATVVVAGPKDKGLASQEPTSREGIDAADVGRCDAAGPTLVAFHRSPVDRYPSHIQQTYFHQSGAMMAESLLSHHVEPDLTEVTATGAPDLLPEQDARRSKLARLRR